jgi:LuxR family quorum sensing-dependent transcriptional regulator
METTLDAARFARCLTTELSETKDAASLRELFVAAIEKLERANTPADVWAPVKSFAAHFGFDYMFVLKGREELASGVASAALYNDMPKGFAEEFDRAGHSPNNPLVLRAFTEARPFTASELWASPLNDRQKRALASLSVSLNVRDGLMVPIRNSLELDGVVLLGGLKPDMSSIMRSSLHLLAHCAFERATALELQPKRKEVGLLSPRETECLRWAALGKTDNEIGTILSISPRTARFHIENAKKKFGVATRIQAVTEALRLRAIAA